jgi:serine/threonine protein phosphatase PrpC
MDSMMLSKEGKKEILKMMSAGDSNGQDTGYEQQSYAGCTANVVIITRTEVICANSGDTRSVMSKKGKVKDLSIDHKPDMPSEKRRIERANGFVEDSRVNGMLALSRAMGDFEYKGNPILKP